MIENVLAVARYEKVQPTVVVIIPPCGSHCTGPEIDTGFRAYFFKGTVPVVTVERAVSRRGGDLFFGESKRACFVGYKQIEPAVVVVISPGGTGTHVLRKL